MLMLTVPSLLVRMLGSCHLCLLSPSVCRSMNLYQFSQLSVLLILWALIGSQPFFFLLKLVKFCHSFVTVTYFMHCNSV